MKGIKRALVPSKQENSAKNVPESAERRQTKLKPLHAPMGRIPCFLKSPLIIPNTYEQRSAGLGETDDLDSTVTHWNHYVRQIRKKWGMRPFSRDDDSSTTAIAASLDKRLTRGSSTQTEPRLLSPRMKDRF